MDYSAQSDSTEVKVKKCGNIAMEKRYSKSECRKTQYFEVQSVALVMNTVLNDNKTPYMISKSEWC